ncbi:hypothetical protein STEG23_030249, partial [Scotinomys teguina]
NPSSLSSIGFLELDLASSSGSLHLLPSVTDEGRKPYHYDFRSATPCRVLEDVLSEKTSLLSSLAIFLPSLLFDVF